jgi:hypothetical protein
LPGNRAVIIVGQEIHILMNKDINEIKATLIPRLTDKLHAHHALYRLPCTGEYLEELVSDSLNEGGILNDWEPNRSHRISLDMETGGGSISVKSGVYKDGFLTFSGSRLTKYKTREERVESIIDHRSDLYVCLAKKDFNPKVKVYYLFIFDKDALDYTGQWHSNDSMDFINKSNMSASIRYSMSHQLWTNISEERVGKPTIIPISGAAVYEQQVLEL